MTDRLPPELSSKEALCAYLGLNEAEAKKIHWFGNAMYSLVQIPKRSGGTRSLHIPDDRLKYIQKKLLVLLDQLFPPRLPVHGFVKGRGAKTNAQEHLGRPYLLNIDLKDFFPSISKNRVYGLFVNLGIDHDISEFLIKCCCVDGRLPQGSPTSPLISNMICFRMDRQFMSFCKRYGIRYTRYADDLSFSMYSKPLPLFAGVVPPIGSIAPELVSAGIREIISANGFELNEAKIRYSNKSSRREVTGCVVNELVNVRRQFVRNLRATLHCIEIQGFDEAQTKFEAAYGGRASLKDVLRGRIEWLGQVKGRNDPVFRRYADHFNRLFPSLPIVTEPTADEQLSLSIWVVEHLRDTEGGPECNQGTAFFLEGVGLVTAAHCVSGAESIEVYHPDRAHEKFSATISRSCSHRDLAILDHTVPIEKFFCLQKRDRSVSTGDKIEVLGYPAYARGNRLSKRSGEVCSTLVRSAVPMVEVGANIDPGLSGGPILDQNGNVVAVCHKGGRTEPFNLGVLISEIEQI